MCLAFAYWLLSCSPGLGSQVYLLTGLTQIFRSHFKQAVLKGVIGYQNSLFKLFEHKCVLEVCVHIHPIII